MKTITSPSKRFAGYVVLPDSLTFDQSFTWRDAVDKEEELRADDADWQHVQQAFIPGLVACVAEWHLEKFPNPVTVENFPSTPMQSVRMLIDWLGGEIFALYMEADDVPLAS